MAVVISSRTVQMIDAVGGRLTQGFFLVEYRDANYTPGGENLVLNSYFRNIEHITAAPASGALEYTPRPNYGDFPTNGGSGRLQLWYSASGLVTLNVSGLPIQILSGNISNLSGLGGLPGGATIASGRIGVVGSGAFNVGIAPIEILSGTAVSGIRTKLFVVGY
jgi:hypothetical protein